MAKKVTSNLDFNNATRGINVPTPVDAGDMVNRGYVDSVVEGLAWKDSVRVAAQSNINLAAPGATINSITMTSGDRFLASSQTAGEDNGIYIWNGASTPATRSLDASTADELEQAVVTVEEGTSAGVSYRQTAVNFTLGTDPVSWSMFGTSAGLASESSAGIAEIATQAEVDSGTDDQRFLTIAKLVASPFVKKKHAVNIGDGSATSFTVTHNFNTRDVIVQVFSNSGDYDTVMVDERRPTVNTVQIVFDASVVPAANAYRVVVIA